MRPATGIARLWHTRSTHRGHPSDRLSTDSHGDVSLLGFPVGTLVCYELNYKMATEMKEQYQQQPPWERLQHGLHDDDSITSPTYRIIGPC